MSWSDGFRLPNQSQPVQRLINEIIHPRASVVASRWVALIGVIIPCATLTFGRPVNQSGDWIAPPDQKPIWFVVAAALTGCIVMLILARRKITVDEMRNIRLLGLCVLQFAFAFALATQARKGIDGLGVIAVWAGAAAIARFLLLLRNPVRS